MKNSYICIKCDGSDVVKIPGGDMWSRGYFNTIKVTSLKQVLVTRFLCLDCGYSEEWIEKDKDIALVSKYYKKNNGDSSHFV